MEINHALISHATDLWNAGMRAPKVECLPSTEIIKGWHMVGIEEVMGHLLSRDAGSDGHDWLQSCHYFCDTVLNGLANRENLLIEDDLPHGIQPIMLANGGLVRARLGISERMFDVPRAARNLLRDSNPSWLEQQIIGKLAIGPWDADFRVVVGDRKKKLIFDSLKKAIFEFFHFDNARNFQNHASESYTFDYYLKRGGRSEDNIYSHASVQLVPLDNGSFNLRFELKHPRNQFQRFNVDITCYPTGKMLLTDCRNGQRQSLRMSDQVIVAKDTRGADYQYVFLESLDHWNAIRVANQGPENIPDIKSFDTLHQITLAGLRMIRGALLDDRVWEQAFDLPIDELIDEKTIRDFRKKLLELAIKQQHNGGSIHDFRIRDIQTEAALVTSLHPQGAARIMCALGLLDIFAPHMGTLFGNTPYDYNENPVAERLIKTMKHTSQYGTLGVYDFVNAVRHLGHETRILESLSLFDIRRYWQ